MSEEGMALDEFINQDRKHNKKGGNNNNFKRSFNNNNQNGGGQNRNFIKRTNNGNKPFNNNNNNNNNNRGNQQYNKEDRYDQRIVKKVNKTISKHVQQRKDSNSSDYNQSQQPTSKNPTRVLAINNATKKVSIPKKLFTVKVKNLPSTINSHEIYELASDKEQVKVESINTTFHCNSDSRLIEAEISYSNIADANTFVSNYHEATLEGQELQVYLI